MVPDSSKGSSARSRLPANRAFVVHLREDIDPADGELLGRVEHVTSGRSARFETEKALIDFLRHALAGQGESEA
jgi:hypothetical protein